ncbi:MAG TPA: hypothetical protein VFV34_22445 [Blastocatellia bacterium]|nr:hypothetical protein [Blastocatellia bacterium]
MSNYPPNNPPGPPNYPPPNYPPPPSYQTQGFGQPPPPKKSNTWMYVLFGCGGLVLIGVIGAVIVFYVVASKAKQTMNEFERNPGFAAAKLAVQMNPDVDLVGSDETAGTLTVRDKKTGETVTLDFRKIKDGKVTFKANNGEEASISVKGSESGGTVEIKSDKGNVVLGGGSAVDLPDWMPGYPGSAAQGVFSAKSSEGDVTSYHFITSDSPSEVMQFYEDKLEAAGLKVTTTATTLSGRASGGTVTAESSDKGRVAAVIVTTSTTGTQVNVNVTSKN